MKAIINLLPFFLMVFYAFFGYMLLKLKKRTGGWYILLIISVTPLFWFIAGLIKAINPTPTTKVWSYVAVLWGIFNLYIILFFKGSF